MIGKIEAVNKGMGMEEYDHGKLQNYSILREIGYVLGSAWLGGQKCQVYNLHHCFRWFHKPGLSHEKAELGLWAGLRSGGYQ